MSQRSELVQANVATIVLACAGTLRVRKLRECRATRHSGNLTRTVERLLVRAGQTPKLCTEGPWNLLYFNQVMRSGLYVRPPPSRMHSFRRADDLGLDATNMHVLNILEHECMAVGGLRVCVFCFSQAMRGG